MDWSIFTLLAKLVTHDIENGVKTHCRNLENGWGIQIGIFKTSFLLQAEHYKLMKNGSMAAISYDASIMAAKEHKFIHEEATANELAGIFYSEQGNRQRALSYFLQSVVCYKKWGASAIAWDVEARIEKQFGKDSMLSAGPIDAIRLPHASPKLCGKTSTKRQY